MLIENPDALKSWLVVILEPLCDADSSALARYVLALLKKEKPEKELKKVMIEQLDVFLGEETTPFVDRLFEAINTKEYLVLPPPILKKASVDIEMDIVPSDDAVNTAIGTNKSDNRTELNGNDVKVASTAAPSASTNTSTVSNINTEKINHTSAINESKAKDSHHYNQKSNDVIAPTSSTSSSATTDNRSTHHTPSAVQKSESGHSHSHTQQPTGHHHHQHHSSTSSSAHNAVSSHVRSASPPARTNADKENQPRDSRRRRASLRSRSRSPRSRSRSNERFSRRSRSRDRRINEREKNHRQFRNKSPPSSTMDSRHINDRRRIGGVERRRIGGGSTRSGGNNNNNDERSPRFSAISGSTETERKPRSNNQRSKSRSRSPSTERTNAAGSRSKASPNNNRQIERRSSSERHRPSLELVPSEKRQRCIDFEEKGYCVRGETCPWDHGVNPVVFEGVNNASILNMSLREYNPDVPDLWATSRVGTGPPSGMLNSGMHVGPGNINPFTGVVRPNTGGAIMGAGPNGAVEFLRTAAVVPGNVAFRGTAPMLPFGFNPPGSMQAHLQRELIPIPVLDATGSTQNDSNTSGKRRYENEDASTVATEGPPKRKLPINSRLGPRVPSMQNNCSLELRKVPRGLNTITHLNNHFAKFGKIVNIQISYDGDPEAAIITFSTHAEANVAYRSTEAVLNNRFIKVFWHNQDNVVSSTITPGNNNDISNRKSSHYHLNKTTQAVSTTSGSGTAAAVDAAKTGSSTPGTGEAASTNSESAATANDVNDSSGTVLAASTQPSLRLKNNVPRVANAAIIRKKQEEQAKAVVQLANGLRKRKQELLQSYLKQMKSALELVERCEPNDPQRSKTLETIKFLQETIDKLRKEIATEQEQIQAQIHNQQPSAVVAPSVKKTKEQQKKELLDIELELFAQQQEGNDTTAIQKRLEELQRSLGIVPGNVGASAIPSGGKPHYPGRSVARVRPTLPEGSTRVDRRPKTIVVTGFAGEEADFVLGHFKNFGEITKHDVDREIPQLILSYATRISAEQAVMRGKLFKDKRLQISWAPVITQATKPISQAIEKSVHEKILNAELAKANAMAIGVSSGVNDIDGKELKPIAKDILPELRLEDEEEEDESEDRSWRR